MKKAKYLMIFGLMLVAVISCNVDVENVELSGYVYDSNEGEPIKNAILKIESYFYGNSPDQSYSDFKAYYLRTDENGFYSIKLDTSALINIDVFKDGYSKGFKSEDFPSKKQIINFYLKKSDSN